MGRAKLKVTEQDDLIPDVRPENEKEILRLAQAFVAAKRAHEKIGVEKDNAAERLVEAARESDIEPIGDDTYIVVVDGTRIEVRPGKVKVKVKMRGDGE